MWFSLKMKVKTKKPPSGQIKSKLCAGSDWMDSTRGGMERCVFLWTDPLILMETLHLLPVQLMLSVTSRRHMTICPSAVIYGIQMKSFSVGKKRWHFLWMNEDVRGFVDQPTFWVKLRVWAELNLTPLHRLCLWKSLFRRHVRLTYQRDCGSLCNLNKRYLSYSKNFCSVLWWFVIFFCLNLLKWRHQSCIFTENLQMKCVFLCLGGGGVLLRTDSSNLMWIYFPVQCRSLRSHSDWISVC